MIQLTASGTGKKPSRTYTFFCGVVSVRVEGIGEPTKL